MLTRIGGLDMNNQEIQNGISEYQRLKQEKEELIKYKERMDQLSKDENVAEYICLANKFNMTMDQSVYKDEQLAFMAFDEIARTTCSSNRIYVFMGRYMETLFGDDVKIPNEDYPLMNYAYDLYYDLENMQKIKVNIYNTAKFQKENRIIKSNHFDLEHYKKYYTKLRIEFLSLLIDNSQEEAVTHFVKKYCVKKSK